MLWSEEGFGFNLNGTNLRKIVNFIIKNISISDKDTLQLEGLADAGDISSLDAFFDAPVSWVIADLINEIEGITLVKGYRDNGRLGQYVGIDPRYVWFMTDRDKAITKSEAQEILRKYSNAFNGDGIIDYFTINFNTEEQT